MLFSCVQFINKSYDILIRTGERRQGTPYKAPVLYEFDEDKYARALREGLSGGW